MTPEEYYDEVVAPQLAKIAINCKDNGLSAVFAVEYAEDGIGETRIFTDDATDDIKSISAHMARLGRGHFSAYTVTK